MVKIKLEDYTSVFLKKAIQIGKFMMDRGELI